VITSVKEVHTSVRGHDEYECTFYNYFICRCVAANVPRYHLFRIDGVQESFEVIGRELTLRHCRSLIAALEPDGTTVKKHRVDRYGNTTSNLRG
jgi:hypothetical protein